MELIKPSYKILDQSSGLDGIYQQIETAGRTCYKSQRPEGQTAKDFVDRMIASKHYAMLEHSTVYLYFPWVSIGSIDEKYSRNKYSKSIFYTNVSFDKDGNSSFIPIEYGKAGHYITTNLRVLVENNWMDDLQYICEPTEHHERRITVRFTTSNGIMRELTRHKEFCVA